MITSVFGLRIDYSHVRFIIHQGQNRSQMNFSQESGRTDRDEHTVSSVIFTSNKIRQECEWIERKESEWAGHLTEGFKAMREWVAG